MNNMAYVLKLQMSNLKTNLNYSDRERENQRERERERDGEGEEGTERHGKRTILGKGGQVALQDRSSLESSGYKEIK